MDVNVNQENEHKMFVTEPTEKNLRTTAFWTKFYAILSFIGVGVMFLSGLCITIVGNLNVLGEMESYNTMPFLMNFKLLGVLYMILSLIMIFPSLFLYQFSTNIKKSLINNNVATLELAIVKMKNYWMFIGISTIVIICLTFIFAIIAGIGAASMM